MGVELLIAGFLLLSHSHAEAMGILPSIGAPGCHPRRLQDCIVRNLPIRPPESAIPTVSPPQISGTGGRLSVPSSSRIVARRRERLHKYGVEEDARPAAPGAFDGLKTTGVYVAAKRVSERENFLGILDRLAVLASPSVIFDVKGSRVYFNSSAPFANELGLVVSLYDLPDVIALARERGIFTIARFIALKDEGLASRVPGTQIMHPLTGKSVGSVWVDGSHEETLRYNREILEELVAAGIDEVNFDYIRYPTEYPLAAIGLSGEQKADRIEAFLRMARETIDRVRPETKLGISTYAILGWNFPLNFAYVGQDIARFAPLVDVVSPMAYPATFSPYAYYNPAKHPGSRMYYLVYRTIKGYQELLGEEHAGKIRPWIQGYGITENNLRDEIAAVYDAGACGYVIWNAGSVYDIALNLMPQIPVPEHCKR